MADGGQCELKADGLAGLATTTSIDSVHLPQPV